MQRPGPWSSIPSLIVSVPGCLAQVQWVMGSMVCPELEVPDPLHPLLLLGCPMSHSISQNLLLISVGNLHYMNREWLWVPNKMIYVKALIIPGMWWTPKEAVSRQTAGKRPVGWEKVGVDSILNKSLQGWQMVGLCFPSWIFHAVIWSPDV